MLREILDTKLFNKLKDLVIVFKVRFENVILEEAQLLKAIRENHKADPILNTLKPITSIDVAIYPMHFTISLS
jgi:hypothetical protein